MRAEQRKTPGSQKKTHQKRRRLDQLLMGQKMALVKKRKMRLTLFISRVRIWRLPEHRELYSLLNSRS